MGKRPYYFPKYDALTSFCRLARLLSSFLLACSLQRQRAWRQPRCDGVTVQEYDKNDLYLQPASHYAAFCTRS